MEEEAGKQYQELGKSKQKQHVRKRATFGRILLSASSGQQSVKCLRQKHGISFSFIKKCRSQVFDRKRPSNALSTKTEQKATDFFNRGDVSRTDPPFASVSLKTQEPKRVMAITLKAAPQVFEEEVNTAISFSRFAKLRPKMTKTVKHMKINTRYCEYCANVALKQEAINNFLSSKAHR